MTNRDAYHFITVLMALKVQPGTKLEHARNQTLKNAASFIESYNDKLEDINIEYCSTDERGNIIRDASGHYVFTKENQRALAKALRNFLDSTVREPFDIVSTADKTGMSDAQVEYLATLGLVRAMQVV